MNAVQLCSLGPTIDVPDDDDRLAALSCAVGERLAVAREGDSRDAEKRHAERRKDSLDASGRDVDESDAAGAGDGAGKAVSRGFWRRDDIHKECILCGGNVDLYGCRMGFDRRGVLLPVP